MFWAVSVHLDSTARVKETRRGKEREGVEEESIGSLSLWDTCRGNERRSRRDTTPRRGEIPVGGGREKKNTRSKVPPQFARGNSRETQGIKKAKQTEEKKSEGKQTKKQNRSSQQVLALSVRWRGGGGGIDEVPPAATAAPVRTLLTGAFTADRRAPAVGASSASVSPFLVIALLLISPSRGRGRDMGVLVCGALLLALICQSHSHSVRDPLNRFKR